ncbi:cation transport regulator ChaB [Alteromonas sp. MB-3u-76]|uniref:ChaB family protein n=1 Tax=Alteromonas sp. MB-3u-76 TaxID=2058133 RepID=UPI000C3110BA|nr:ChaB family protein [Alteromonas sp. MB-3u-76]AUC89368.1 cation transport regulator ChaB [Alteromonas sp. MB-3u-76]
MPYDKKSDLPEQVQDNLPSHAEEIFKEAYNNAYEQYKDPDDRDADDSREEVAFKVARSAVKQKYEKNENGDWVKK